MAVDGMLNDSTDDWRARLEAYESQYDHIFPALANSSTKSSVSISGDFLVDSQWKDGFHAMPFPPLNRMQLPPILTEDSFSFPPQFEMTNSSEYVVSQILACY